MDKPTHIDRLPPHDPAAERGVIGSILLAPSESLSVCQECIGHETFYDMRHQLIYRACVEIAATNALPDMITLCAHLSPTNGLAQVGGREYLMQMMGEVPSAAQLPEYLRIVADKHRMRRLIALCIETVQTAYESNGDSHEVIEQFEVEAMRVREASQAVSGIVDVTATLQDLLNDYERACHHGEPIGIGSGFVDLDKISGAMMPGELILLAGIQSSGKTTLAMNIAWHVAQSLPVGIFSLETTGKKLLHRLACLTGQFNGGAFLSGKAEKQDYPRATNAFARLSGAKDRLLINETGGMTMGQISGAARRMHKAGAVLFVIDYLQLINAGGKTEYERTTAVSKLIKNMAKETNCPVIAISSLSRASSIANREPQLSDLRASGQLEYDANKVWLLHADSQTNIQVHVAKNKDGPTGKTTLFYVPEQFRMENAAKV